MGRCCLTATIQTQNNDIALVTRSDIIADVCSFLLFWSITVLKLLNVLNKIVKFVGRNYKLRLISVSLRREKMPYCGLFQKFLPLMHIKRDKIHIFYIKLRKDTCEYLLLS